jgi:hypothetical protein
MKVDVGVEMFFDPFVMFCHAHRNKSNPGSSPIFLPFFISIAR